MQIRLDKDVEDRLLVAAGKQSRSVSEIANTILRSVDLVDALEHLKITLKTDDGNRTYERRRRYVIDL